MRLGLALALLVSTLLIGTASWYRFATTKYVQSDLVAIQPFDTENAYSEEEILSDFLRPKTASSTFPEGPLSNTDIIGRQLIMDYIGLAASGGTDTKSISILVDRYIESIPTLNQAATISTAELRTISNTKSNFQNYATGLTKIYKEYATQISAAYQGVGRVEGLNPAIYSFALTASNAYAEAALKLKNLPVPASLASTHLQLVNSYYSSAAAMRAIAETERDSVSAFAGMTVLSENTDKEKVLLTEISQILTSNGI